MKQLLILPWYAACSGAGPIKMSLVMHVAGLQSASSFAGRGSFEKGTARKAFKAVSHRGTTTTRMETWILLVWCRPSVGDETSRAVSYNRGLNNSNRAWGYIILCSY